MKNGAHTMSKKAFILKHPHHAPADLVKKAKAAKITFDVSYVYKVRSKTRTPKAKTVQSRPSTDSAIHAAVERFAFEIRDLTLNEISRRLQST